MLRCAIFLALAASSWAAPLVSASYDEALAERLVSYAGAAYCAGSPSVTDWDCYACKRVPGFQNITSVHDPKTCLLYTSDAADEEDSVDLGGRRIIKKKKQRTNESNRKKVHDIDKSAA
eukprot:TRINITY_DN423_c0_g1_i1.p1 TRINITY_DN423_c0_g1~~TRINITY_DN423_c0_g1_i1.p1  ORF type:complete len:119 (-),score=15.00 TRINITY_DN423_c0_g1_i1:19-375(-)